MAEPHVPYNQGYDVITTKPRNRKRSANAFLVNRVANTTASLHVSSFDTALSLSGSTGQSPMTRDFYPHNFVQTTLNITCQAPGDFSLGEIAEFIHTAQRDCVRTGKVMALSIPEAGLFHTSRTMRGRASAINAFGYVRSMPRSHKRHSPAPDFQFDFVISRMREGLFHDTPYKAYKLAKWSDIFDAVIGNHLVNPPKEDVDQDIGPNPFDQPNSIFNQPGLSGH
jgi:hypothetical protein